ncbi:MAG: OmpA family protein [Alphaproteobacteria bacterium]|nr:OmpA family protein [Alphaproteobacteria bacterium]
MAAGSNLPPIIVKRTKRNGHGAHHGSTTWKIALADFMTAMFIIFLCLWLINQITPEQRTGIADYFSPASVSRTTSGSGAVLGGQTITVPGALKQNTAPVSPTRGGGPSSPQEGEGNTQVPGYPGSTNAIRGDKPGGDAKGGRGPGAGGGQAAEAPKPVTPQIQGVIDGIKGIEGLPGVTDKINVMVEPTEEGLRIQLVDSDKRELFARGNANALPHTRELMKQVAKIIEKVPNKVAISGYTDGVPFGKNANYTNWELSADRANASRRLLVEAGIPDDRFASVTGRGDRDPLITSDPAAPGNRRISITLLREKTEEEKAAAAASNGAAGAGAPTPGSATGTSKPIPGPAPEGRLIPR